MDLNRLPSAITQIIYFTIPKDKDLVNRNSESGKIWAESLNIVKSSSGFTGLCWGRSVETPDKVQLHITRDSLQRHQDWLASSEYRKFLQLLKPLIGDTVGKPTVRHVTPMSLYTTNPTTAFRAPVTGTAIYTRTTSAWHEGSWPCWTHIVRHVAGNSGIAGGKLLELYDAQISKHLAGISAPDAKNQENADKGPVTDCYLVYVGWETIKAHNDYHHTDHFAKHGLILRIGNSGWREYGHIKFEGWEGQFLETSSDAPNSAKI